MKRGSRRRLLWLAPLLAPLFLAPACSGSGTGSGGGDATSSSSGGVTVPPDAMCDILNTLQYRCWSCHGTKVHAEAEDSLVTLEQLKAPSLIDPDRTLAERSVIRMKAEEKPMPPIPGETPTAAEIKLLEAWIAAGYPEASCGDAAKDPFAAASKCSGKQLPSAQGESEEMNPGRVCNTCHQEVNDAMGGDAPLFMISGTVYPTAHEPDDCTAPAAEGATVEITDSMGKVVTLTANATGNFFYEENDLVFPYTAKVFFEGRMREMVLPTDRLSCNECHTKNGDDEAPGRILLP